MDALIRFFKAYAELKSMWNKLPISQILKNENLEIHIDLPNENYNFSRFDWTGKITEVKFQNISLSSVERIDCENEHSFGKGFSDCRHVANRRTKGDILGGHHRTQKPGLKRRCSNASTDGGGPFMAGLGKGKPRLSVHRTAVVAKTNKKIHSISS